MFACLLDHLSRITDHLTSCISTLFTPANNGNNAARLSGNLVVIDSRLPPSLAAASICLELTDKKLHKLPSMALEPIRKVDIKTCR